MLFQAVQVKSHLDGRDCGWLMFDAETDRNGDSFALCCVDKLRLIVDGGFCCVLDGKFKLERRATVFLAISGSGWILLA